MCEISGGTELCRAHVTAVYIGRGSCRGQCKGIVPDSGSEGERCMAEERFSRRPSLAVAVGVGQKQPCEINNRHYMAWLVWRWKGKPGFFSRYFVGLY